MIHAESAPEFKKFNFLKLKVNIFDIVLTLKAGDRYRIGIGYRLFFQGIGIGIGEKIFRYRLGIRYQKTTIRYQNNNK